MDEGGGVGEGEKGTGGRDTQDLTATAPSNGLNIEGREEGTSRCQFSTCLWPFGVSLGCVCALFHWVVHLCLSPLPLFVGGRKGIQTHLPVPPICLLLCCWVRGGSPLIMPFAWGCESQVSLVREFSTQPSWAVGIRGETWVSLHGNCQMGGP